MNNQILPICTLLLLLSTNIVYSEIDLSQRVIHAVNCGGEQLTGAYNILYKSDFLTEGFPSDFGKKFAFANVNQKDRRLYQTERYGLESFKYRLKLLEDGDFVLILKFSEVYFTEEGQKVFNVKFNNNPIISNLDILKEIGAPGLAYDRQFPFSINGNILTVNGRESNINNKEIIIEFEKTHLDNPKVNAILILKGIEGIPSNTQEIPDWSQKKQSEEEIVEEEEFESGNPDEHSFEILENRDSHGGIASGPKTRNPFDSQGDSGVLIIILSLLVFVIPVVTLLRKL